MWVSHLEGFSPVCIVTCLCKLLLHVTVLPQVSNYRPFLQYVLLQASVNCYFMWKSCHKYHIYRGLLQYVISDASVGHFFVKMQGCKYHIFLTGQNYKENQKLDRRICQSSMFLISQYNLYCGYSLEAHLWGASSSNPQQILFWRYKNYQYFLVEKNTLYSAMENWSGYEKTF